MQGNQVLFVTDLVWFYVLANMYVQSYYQWEKGNMETVICTNILHVRCLYLMPFERKFTCLVSLHIPIIFFPFLSNPFYSFFFSLIHNKWRKLTHFIYLLFMFFFTYFFRYCLPRFPFVIVISCFVKFSELCENERTCVFLNEVLCSNQ